MTFEQKRQLGLDILKLMFPDDTIVMILAVSHADGSMLHVGSTADKAGTEFMFRSLLGQEDNCVELN